MTKPKNRPRNRATLNQTEGGFEIALRGIVGDDWDGFTADSVSDLVRGLEGEGTLIINSPGGLVFEGVDIYHLLKSPNLTVRVQGLAASIASVIALAGKRIEIARGSSFMIHNPWNIAFGDSREMRKSAEVLDQLKENIIDIYEDRTGLERSFLAEMMDEETWLTADEAVEFGFADEVVGGADQDASNEIRNLDLSILANARHMPDQIAAMATISASSRKPRAAAPINPETEERTMNNANPQAPAAPETANPKAEAPKADSAAEAQAAASKAVAEERERCTKIKALCKEKELAAEFGERLINDGVALDDATRQINNLAEYMASVPGVPDTSRPGSIEISRDERDTTRDAVALALLNRFNARRYAINGDSPARDWRGDCLMDIARKMVENSGVRTKGMSKHEVARAALHTTSDFPKILENVIGKSLRDGYELAPRTFVELANQTTLPDYKEVSRAQLGEAPKLDKVLEGGEYTSGTIGEAAEKYRLFKYGKILPIAAEVLINDDLDAFTRIPSRMGSAAGQLESQLFWAHFTGNPTMHDGTTLFHADHGNLAGAGAAISIAAISAGRAAMRKQKGLDNEHFINVQPQTLVVPSDLETIGEQFVSQNMLADASGDINPFAGRLRVITEPRLDVNSTTAWYLWANPAMVDTIEYAYLQGEEGPQIETQEGFDVDGMKVKVRHNFGVKALDWRGLYKNAGA